jgi:hypothetical protein
MTTKQKAIEHYERMIEWAKTRHPDENISTFIMFGHIKETWAGVFCAYCIDYECDCSKCPLEFNDECCGDLYCDMINSSTWSEWITNANKVLDYIRDKG